MKLPAVAIAAAFAGGIAIGLSPLFAARGSSVSVLLFSFALALVLLAAGLFLAVRGWLRTAAGASLLCWIALGVAGAAIVSQPRPANHILALVEAGNVELSTPLRWHGRLRDEPARLPWATGYEIELSGVEYAGELAKTQGGMRLSYTPRGDEEPLPDLHAGDAVSFLTEARLPQVFRDEGAFDRRAYLAAQGIDLTAALRAPGLIERVAAGRWSFAVGMAKARRRLRAKLDELFAGQPQPDAVLRAMLLGDRSFVEREAAVNFQKTGVFHVLVVAGLHVGALAAFLFWIERKLRWPGIWTALLALLLLFAYVSVVEQRAPVLRAALMAAIVVAGRFFHRRLDLLNSAAVAALALLAANPGAIKDSSFQLSFLAIGCIAGIAVPWMESTVQPYVRALRGWRDLTRDAAYPPQQAQFRIDLRAAAAWISGRVPARIGAPAENIMVGGIAASLRVWELFALSLVLQIGMLPLMARDFHRVTLVGPFANLVAVPLTGVIVPLGFVALGSALLIPFLGKILAAPLAWLTVLLARAMHWFVQWPHGSYRIPGPPAWLMLLFFAFAAGLAVALRLQSPVKRKLLLGATAALAVSAVVIAWYPFAPKWNPGKLELNVLDVGQGDSLLVVSPDGRVLLVDGGGAFAGIRGEETHGGAEPGEEAVSPFLWSRGFQHVDVVALTHAHQDHLGGLTAVLQNFSVSKLWIGREVQSAALEKLEALARDKHIDIQHENRGAAFDWGGMNGKFLWPELPAGEPAPQPKNSDSLVLKLQFGERSFLLPGDAEKDAEREMLAENDAGTLRADVLKVGHHGSKNSTTAEFLAAVQPAVAIISAGEANPYGHPAPALLERLQNSGARILRSDRDGAVRLVTDGRQMEISCFVACPENAARAGSIAEERQRPAPKSE